MQILGLKQLTPTNLTTMKSHLRALHHVRMMTCLVKTTSKHTGLCLNCLTVIDLVKLMSKMCMQFHSNWTKTLKKFLTLLKTLISTMTKKFHLVNSLQHFGSCKNKKKLKNKNQKRDFHNNTQEVDMILTHKDNLITSR